MAGFGFGQAAINVSSSFCAHQKEMYLATFGGNLRSYKNETTNSGSQAVLSLFCSVAGIVFGMNYLNKNASSFQLIEESIANRPNNKLCA